jgi:amino acid permease
VVPYDGSAVPFFGSGDPSENFKLTFVLHSLPSKRRLSGFPEIGYEAFGKVGRALVLAFNYTLLLTTPVLYLILAGDNLAALLQPLHVPLTMKAWVWILTVAVCIPFIMVKNMKEVAVMR